MNLKAIDAYMDGQRRDWGFSQEALKEIRRDFWNPFEGGRRPLPEEIDQINLWKFEKGGEISGLRLDPNDTDGGDHQSDEGS